MLLGMDLLISVSFVLIDIRFLARFFDLFSAPQ